MYCHSCGTQSSDQNIHCTKCGAQLHAGAAEVAHSLPPPAAASATTRSAIEVIIPYKNAAALTAYYLGIFSILCGLFLGIPALILGIQGVRYANLHPEVKGKAHAWTGIILGSVTTLVSLALLVLAIGGVLGRK